MRRFKKIFYLFLPVFLALASGAYAACNMAVSVTSTGTAAGGATGANFDSLTSAIIDQTAVCDAATIFIYININESPTITRGVNIQGVGSVTWTGGTNPFFHFATGTEAVTVQNMVISNTGNSQLFNNGSAGTTGTGDIVFL